MPAICSPTSARSVSPCWRPPSPPGPAAPAAPSATSAPRSWRRSPTACTLVAVAVAIAIAAIGRLGDPPSIDGAGVLALGFVGLAGNLAATVVLARGQREDLNLEGVLRHSLADALGSLGVLLAGAFVLAGGSRSSTRSSAC